MGYGTFDYNNGQSQITAQSEPAPGGGGDPYASLFNEVIRDQMARKKRMDDMREELARREFSATTSRTRGVPPMAAPMASETGMQRRPMGPSLGSSAGNDPLGEQEKQLHAMQMSAAMNALQGPPLRYTPGGFNMDSHLEMDTLHMSPQQRRAFLPGGSQTIEGPGPGMSGSREWAQMGARNDTPRYQTTRGI